MSCVFTRELDREPQQYSTYYLYKVSIVHAMTVHCPTLMSITHLPCVFLKATMPCPCALTSYSLISIIHVCTMYIPWGTHVPWRHPNPRLFLILLDPKSFQTTLDFFRPMTSCHVTSQSYALSFSCCRLIIILLLYLICPNPNPKVCPHFQLITLWSFSI